MKIKILALFKVKCELSTKMNEIKHFFLMPFDSISGKEFFIVQKDKEKSSQRNLVNCLFVLVVASATA